MLKRTFDVVVALVLLLVVAPLLGVLWLVGLVNLGSPVLFRQERPGLYGRPFHINKFRTMREAFDSDGAELPDEQRMTMYGKFLRRSSLDELPELWNVLVGEMSLVGPRPLLMEYLSLYTEFQARRHEVRPGITGYAQVRGRNSVDWEDRFEMDVWYVDNRSFRLDLMILMQTVGAVTRGAGVSQKGRATMDRFTGGGDRD